jgi:F420-dependent oxidoreductase-like protein
MRLGLKIASTGGTGNDVDELVAQARAAADAGLASVWTPQGYGLDAMGALAVVAREVPGIEVGVTVVPVQTRHVITAASQAKTLQAASRGRAVLAIGASHPGLAERYGVPFERPATHVEEYLDALLPLLRGAETEANGAYVRASTLGIPSPVAGAEAGVPVLLGALGPRMLRAAGGRADGTVTFMAGRHTVAEHIAPAVRHAAEAAGRPAPRIVVGVTVGLTADPERLRRELDAGLAWLADLPSYRRLLDLEGVRTPSEIALVGDGTTITTGLAHLAAAGATDLNITLAGTPDERRRTLELLAGG